MGFRIWVFLDIEVLLMFVGSWMIVIGICFVSELGILIIVVWS